MILNFFQKIKTIVGDYGFRFKVKIIVDNCGFKIKTIVDDFKPKTIITNYHFNFLKL